MSPNRFFHFMLVLVLTIVLVDSFTFRIEKVRAESADPTKFLTGCHGQMMKQQLYHRNAQSHGVNSGHPASRHLLYHRDVKSCYSIIKVGDINLPGPHGYHA